MQAVYDFFKSIRLTIFLLLTLALVSIIGTLIQQNQSPAVYLERYGETLYRLFVVLDFFDMYRSWWFQLLLILLTINIVVCSVDRLKKTWKIIFPQQVKIRPERFQQLADKVIFDVHAPLEEVRDQAVTALRRHYRTTHQTTTPEGGWVYAEKQRYSRLGVYVVHVSIIFMLIGAIIGSWFGFDGFVNIPEGETIQHARLFHSTETVPLDFAVRCDRFSVTFYDTGAPREYRSTLTIIENGQPVLTRDIIVNDPLRYRGINFYQSSYGPLPPSDIVLSATSRASGMVYHFEAIPGRPVDLAEGLGTFELLDYRRDFGFRGRNIGEALIGVVRPVQGSPREVVLPLRFPDFDRMGPGDVQFAVMDYQQRFFTGLQVTRDPGVWIVYTGFILILVGCYMAFCMAHQQVLIFFESNAATVRVSIAGITNKHQPRLQRVLERVAGRLQAGQPAVPGHIL